MVRSKEMNCMVHELYLNEPINKAIYITTYIQILRLAEQLTYCTYKHILGNMQARVAFKNIEKLVLTHQNQSQALPSREHV